MVTKILAYITDTAE